MAHHRRLYFYSLDLGTGTASVGHTGELHSSVFDGGRRVRRHLRPARGDEDGERESLEVEILARANLFEFALELPIVPVIGGALDV